MTWPKVQLRRLVRMANAATPPIKGSMPDAPGAGLFRGYSASGQDVWLPPYLAPFQGPGIVISAVGARCGKAFLADGRWGIVANTAVLLPEQNVDPRYLWYLVNDETFWEIRGSAQPYVQFQRSLHRKVTAPPLEAQESIADYLDHETAKIDTLIAKQEALISTLRERRQALVDHAFATSASTPRLQLGRLLRVRPTYGVLVPQYVDADPGVSLVRVGDLDKLAPDSPLRQISIDQSAEYSRTILTGGEVLLGVVGNMGRAVVAPHWLDGANVVRAIAVLRCLEPTCAPLLAAWFSSTHFLNQAELATSGDSVQPTLGMGDLAHFTIEWPASQAMLTETWRDLEAQTTRIDILIAKAKQFIGLTCERRAALITAAVTGDVDPRA